MWWFGAAVQLDMDYSCRTFVALIEQGDTKLKEAKPQK